MKNDHEKMLATINQNFEKQIEKILKEHSREIAKLNEDMKIERESMQKREKDLLRKIEEMKAESQTWMEQISQLQVTLSGKDAEIRGM